MMKKLSYLVTALLLVAASCKDGERQTPSGLKYTVLKTGGQPATPGKILVFDFELKDSKDSLWHSSYKEGVSARMEVRDTSQMKGADGISEMLNALGKGDSVKTTMSVTDFFRKLVGRDVPPGVDSSRSVTYTIKVHDAMNVEEYVPWREKQVAERDDRKINEYLKEHNLQAKKDTSGIYYILHKEQGNAKPAPDKCVEVAYVGRFLQNGQPFDSNERIGFSLNEVIRGWTLSIPMLGKGDSATFYIPSKLAYGPQGYPGAIPPDAVLIFDVELLDFNNEVDPVTRTCK